MSGEREEFVHMSKSFYNFFNSIPKTTNFLKDMLDQGIVGTNYGFPSIRKGEFSAFLNQNEELKTIFLNKINSIIAGGQETSPTLEQYQILKDICDTIEATDASKVIQKQIIAEKKQLELAKRGGGKRKRSKKSSKKQNKRNSKKSRRSVKKVVNSKKNNNNNNNSKLNKSKSKKSKSNNKSKKSKRSNRK